MSINTCLAKMTVRLAAALVLGFLHINGSIAAQTDTDAIRVDAARFGALPRIAAPALSPDGTHIAALEPVAGRFAVVVRPVDHLDQKVIAFQDKNVSVDWMRWVNANRLVVGTSFPGKRLGIATIETRLFGVDADGAHRISLPHRSGRNSPQVGTDLVSLLRDDPRHLLLNIDRDNRGSFSVYRVDVETGDADLVEPGTPLTADWLADARGVVRLRLDYSGTAREVWARSGHGDPWRLVRRDEVLDNTQFVPLVFSQSDPDQLIVASDAETGRLAIYPFDIATSKLGPALFRRADADIQGVIQDAASGSILGYTFTRDREVREFLNADISRRQDQLDALFPGHATSVVSTARGGGLAVLFTEVPGRPGRYVLRDPGPGGAVTPFGSQYPALDNEPMAEIVPWSYRARDNLTIASYVTLPMGASLSDVGGKWPLVLMPHGGPTARDTMGFDFIAQFLARRGYAVLQPNFRGSTGYGRAFETAGNGEWGRAMQDDVTDGARALISSGFADAARVAIVGTSYGGYSALIGAAREPDLFRSAVSISGVTDLTRFMNDLDHFRFAEVRKPRIVNPPNDRTALAERSPVATASRIKVPVLLVHGRKDHVVPFEHATAMKRALKRSHVPVRLLALPESDHNLNVEPERIALLTAVGEFLAETLR